MWRIWLMADGGSTVALARAVLVLGAITAGTLMLGPFQGAERLFLLSDKQAHALAFFGLTSVSFMAAPKVRRLDLVMVAIALGASAEVAQAAVGRDGNFADLFADSMGVALAWWPTHVEALRRRAQAGWRERRSRRGANSVRSPSVRGERAQTSSTAEQASVAKEISRPAT